MLVKRMWQPSQKRAPSMPGNGNEKAPRSSSRLAAERLPDVTWHRCTLTDASGGTAAASMWIEEVWSWQMMERLNPGGRASSVAESNVMVVLHGKFARLRCRRQRWLAGVSRLPSSDHIHPFDVVLCDLTR